ncbi:23231_t:CDS:2, partial [Cetraspora pellucida]
MSKQSTQVIRYRGRKSDNYSSNSDVYSDNISESGSKNCSDYSSDYESDTETTIKSPILQLLPKVEEQVSNMTSSTEQASLTYPKWQERFDDKFTQKDDYLLPNYRAKEGINKQAPKFSVIDDISKIYGLPGIHECINGQWLLRPVIDINASKERIEAENINTKNVFFSICCSFVRALYRILDCSWKEIIKELVIMTLSDDNKCSYYLLYTPALLVDYLELKEFTELVFRLTGEKYKKFINRGLPDRNFYNRWYNLNDSRVQLPINMNLEQNRDKSEKIFNDPSITEKIQQKNKNNVPPPISHKIKDSKFPKLFLEMLGWIKYNESLTTSERYKERYVKPLSKENDIYI